MARWLTFGAVVVGWVLFRSTSLDMARTLYESMVGLHGLGSLAYLVSLGPGKRFILLLIGLFILTNIPRDTWTMHPRRTWVYEVGLAVLLVMSLLLLGKPQMFLYFQF
jgi:hypothetical protein